VAQGASRIACDALILNKSTTNTPNHMEDTLWSEIADAPGEIFDIPEMRDDEDNDDRSFNAFLNSNWDF
jgi:hypothetical protein